MNQDNLHGYSPSVAAGVFFIILFAATTGNHAWQSTRARRWYFILVVISGIFQIIGYVCRVIAHYNLSSVPIYGIQSVLILLAPPLYAASVYMVLGRLVRCLHAEHLSLVPVKWMTKIFVSGGVFSFLLQASVLCLATKQAPETRAPTSLSALLFFGFFVIVAAIFHLRINKHPTSKSASERQRTAGQGWRQRNWSTVLLSLYVVSTLILIKSIFHLIEYKYGYDGYIMTHEVFSYVFDAVMMFVAMTAMNFYHPAVIIGDGKNDLPYDSEETGL